MTDRPLARRTIAIGRAQGPDGCGCAGGEPFALLVLGDSMAPGFVDGDVIVVEPDGLAVDGAFVVAFAGEWMLRRLDQRPDGGWRLTALDPRWPAIDLADLQAVRGVVIQKSRPGRRATIRRYGAAGAAPVAGGATLR